MVRALYGDQTELMERESMGAITSDADSVFNMDDIDSLMQMDPLRQDVEYFFVAVDPTGGGTSEMAIVSLVLVDDRCYIMGLDSSPANGPDEIRALLLQHIRALRGHPCLRSAYCIFIPESNLGQEAEHMKHMVKDERKVFTIHEKKKAGVNTTHKRKQLYAQTMLEYTRTTRIDPACVCVNPNLDATKRLLHTKKEFRKQLTQFKKLQIPAAKPFDLPKIIYTGKTKKGMNDDLVMTLMIGVFWGREFLAKRIPNVPYEKLR